MPITRSNHTHSHILSSAVLPRRPLAAGSWLASVLMTWRLWTPAFGINGLCRSTTGPLDTFAPMYADAMASNRWSMGVTALTNLIMRTNDGHQVWRGGWEAWVWPDTMWHIEINIQTQLTVTKSRIKLSLGLLFAVTAVHWHYCLRSTISPVAAGGTVKAHTQHKTCSSAAHTSVAVVGLLWNKKAASILIWQPNAGRTTHFTSRRSTDTHIPHTQTENPSIYMCRLI